LRVQVNCLAKVMKSREPIMINDRFYYFYVRYESKASVNIEKYGSVMIK
jgi:hypothetical protein